MRDNSGYPMYYVPWNYYYAPYYYPRPANQPANSQAGSANEPAVLNPAEALAKMKEKLITAETGEKKPGEQKAEKSESSAINSLIKKKYKVTCCCHDSKGIGGSEEEGDV